MSFDAYASMRRSFEPWFLACALVSFTTTGVVPILLPLEVHSDQSSAMSVGLVTAAIGAGMLTAPLWGGLADRRSWHRALLTGGVLAVGAAVYGFQKAEALTVWMLWAMLMGCGVASAFTVSNLLIVGRHPEAECDERIGWLQTFVSVGTVGGLAAAGLVSSLPHSRGFEVGLFACGAGALAAALGTPSVGALRAPAAAAEPRDPSPAEPSPPGGPVGLRKPHPEWCNVSGSHRLPTLPKAARPRMGGLTPAFLLFLFLFFVSSLGMYGLNALYPLMMRIEFSVDPSVSSFVLALATAASTLLFFPAGRLTGRWGGRAVLALGLALRLVGISILAALALYAFPHPGWGALFAFSLATLAWPFLSVSSTLLVGRLLPDQVGSGMGLYNAMIALSGMVGPILSGRLADLFSYDGAVLLAFGGLVLGLVLLAPLARLGPGHGVASGAPLSSAA